MKKSIIVAAAASLLAIPAVAQMQPAPGASAMPAAGLPAPAMPASAMRVPMTRSDTEARLRNRLTQMDANRDGTVTRSEVMTQRQDRRFAAMDANRDGSISRAEFDAQANRQSARRAERAERRADRREARGQTGDRPMRGAMMRRGARGQGNEIAMLARGDANGSIVIAEAVKRALDRFDATDSNRDGLISADERRAARESMRAEWRARRG